MVYYFVLLAKIGSRNVHVLRVFPSLKSPEPYQLLLHKPEQLTSQNTELSTARYTFIRVILSNER